MAVAEKKAAGGWFFGIFFEFCCENFANSAVFTDGFKEFNR